jgi:hypothetical protein
MDALTYLSKDGKVSGPFDSKQVESMKASGEFFTYEWMWDGQAPDWSPVPRKAPPPLPPSGGAPAATEKTKTSITVTESAPAAAKTAPAAAKAKTAATSTNVTVSKKSFAAVLFDGRQTLGGAIEGASSKGARFLSNPSNSVPFSKGASANVDMLDESSDRSAKVLAQITGVSRMGDRWAIDLEWAGCPLL